MQIRIHRGVPRPRGSAIVLLALGEADPRLADPGCRQAGQIYRGDDGSRGVYFRDPDGHLMEILTQPAR